MRQTQSFTLFGRALKNARKDFWVSIQVLLVATVLLAILFYIVEHWAQPDEYSNPWQAFVWAITRYIGDPGKFAGAGPITLTGRYIDTLIGIIKILIFAVPAGLVANGFKKAMDDEKRRIQLETFKERMHKAFRRKQCRHTLYKVVPRFVSIVDIQAKQGMDTKDILDTVAYTKDFRLRNLATTQNVTEYPQDRLVVEHFSLANPTSYGCLIDRGSDVTIVSTSSPSEAGIGNFAYYLALFGSFNYVSKEFEQNPDSPTSYYVVQDEQAEPQLSDFMADLRRLSGEGKWTIFLLSASGAEEPVYPTQVHFIHRVQEKLGKQPTTTLHEEKFQTLYQELETMLSDDFSLQADQDQYHKPVGKKNVGVRIGAGETTDAFTLRIAFSVTVWDDRCTAIQRRMAEIIQRNIAPQKPFEEKKEWKENGNGFWPESESVIQ